MPKLELKWQKKQNSREKKCLTKTINPLTNEEKLLNKLKDVMNSSDPSNSTTNYRIDKFNDN